MFETTPNRKVLKYVKVGELCKKKYLIPAFDNRVLPCGYLTNQMLNWAQFYILNDTGMCCVTINFEPEKKGQQNANFLLFGLC